MRQRTLSLKRETLAALSPDEMSGIVGGSHACTVGHGPTIDETCPTPTLPVAICVQEFTHEYPTNARDCTSS